MRKWFLILFALIAVAASAVSGLRETSAQKAPATPAKPSPTATIPEEDQVIKIETEAVNVLFTAQDKNRRLLTGLTAEDVKILENGQPQEIVAFSRQIDLPLHDRALPAAHP